MSPLSISLSAARAQAYSAIPADCVPRPGRCGAAPFPTENRAGGAAVQKNNFALFPSLYLSLALRATTRCSSTTRGVCAVHGAASSIPFRDISDPTSVSYGNPELEPGILRLVRTQLSQKLGLSSDIGFRLPAERRQCDEPAFIYGWRRDVFFLGKCVVKGEFRRGDRLQEQSVQGMALTLPPLSISTTTIFRHGAM